MSYYRKRGGDGGWANQCGMMQVIYNGEAHASKSNAYLVIRECVRVCCAGAINYVCLACSD